eukprot:2260713-Rhodomonas_salina.1
MRPRCKFKGCDRPVFCDRDWSFMHNYCCRTHARMDGALGGQPHGDGGVGRSEPTVTVPDVERDVDYAN